MPSRAYTDTLEPLLADADALGGSYTVLQSSRRTPNGGRAAVARAMAVLCVSAWEAFVEELVREALTLLRPPAPPMGVWPALNASVRGALGRFNTPNADQVRSLLSESLGLPDVPNSWAFEGFEPPQNRERLHRLMELRHQIAHGTNPRPAVPIRYARPLPRFVRYLALASDAAVRTHLVETLGIPNPWPE